jgi:membrane-bound lytic murein transglycosylase B
MRLAGQITTGKIMKRILALSLVSILSASCLAQQHPGAEAFAEKASAEYELDQAQVMQMLEKARYKQSIVDAISRPAEGKPWYDYRPIFITDKRIRGGIKFWEENRELIAQAAGKYGVDPHVIVAIIGVETNYGGNTGGYRVLDALATLSFYYPDTGRDRSDFFSKELMNFFVLAQEEGIPADEVTGSYAGAMAWASSCPAVTVNTQSTWTATAAATSGVRWPT